MQCFIDMIDIDYGSFERDNPRNSGRTSLHKELYNIDNAPFVFVITNYLHLKAKLYFSEMASLAFKKLQPEDYYKAHIDQGVRPDGRGSLTSSRPVSISVGSIGT